MPEALTVEADPVVLLDGFRLEDAPSVVDLAGDWEVAKWTASIPYPYSLEMAYSWIGSQEHDTNNIIFAVRVDNRLVGCISFTKSSGEVGYWIGRRFWRRGFATAALRRLLTRLRSRGYRGRVAWGACLRDNAASRRVLEKAGFRQYGTSEVMGRLRHNAEPLMRYLLTL
jgi:RimJ/RimL family protein N-acetyltransferase